jgi:Tol biopolymer transport system component
VTSAAIADAFAGQTTRVSVSSTGDPARAVLLSDVVSRSGVISADGRYVVFWSTVTNLVPGVVGGQVYRHDRTGRETVLVSATTTGAGGNNLSRDPSVSADGRFVAFSSTATDLVAGDANNGMSDVFVRDMDRDPALGGAIALVSANSAGVQGDMASSLSGLSGAREISDDGRYVVFMSNATNFDAVNNGMSQLYRKDMTSGALLRVSVNNAGEPADQPSQAPAISGDGDTVAFNSAARNLSDRSTIGLQQVFVRELPLGPTTLGSLGAADTARPSMTPVLSTTGRYLAFESAGVLDTGDLDNGTLDVYLLDRDLDTTVLASRSPNAVQGATSFGPSISGDGRWVAYSSIDDKVFGDDPSFDTNGITADVFIYDRDNPSVRYVSLNDAGEQATLPSVGGSVSGDGHFVLFASAAPNLVPVPASSGSQLYVRNLLSNQPPVVDAGPDETVAEGGWLKRIGSFSDLDASTSWTATADLGAGAFPIFISPQTKQWLFSHEPLAVGTYVVTVSVTDGEGATGSDTFNHTVTNVAPFVDLGPEAFLYFDASLHRAVNVIDPGNQWPVPQPAETYRSTVDYGDGTSAAFDGTFFWLDHTYATDGTYVVKVNASDSNGGVSIGTLTVHVFEYTFEWADSVGDKFVVGRNLPVKFTVRGPDGSFVLDRSVRVDVIDAANNVVAGPYMFGDQPSRAVTVSGDYYHVNVDTRDLEAGMYWLRVTFSSPTLSGEFTLGASGTASAVRSRLRD